MPLITRVVYLFDITTRSACKYQNLYLRGVQLIDENNLLVISYIDSNANYFRLLHVIIDFGAQLFMISKEFFLQLNLSVTNLEPCVFTIITLVESNEQAINYVRQLFQLIF